MSRRSIEATTMCPTRSPGLLPGPSRFAVVLRSGGVCSVAAFGMFEVLAGEGLAPDLIVGCSAGAMFGALIAAGHSATEAVTMPPPCGRPT
jgi:NTE family protein